jgi:hypothetical protein
MSDALFATFWQGPFNPTAYSCAASFAAVGAELRIYTYQRDFEAPDGVEVSDARAILADDTLPGRYISGGRPSLATFSDRFRYEMLAQTGLCWVDADIVCLEKPDFGSRGIVWGRQPEARGKALINNAVMKLPVDHPVLLEMLERARQSVDSDMSWGAIGPFLLTDVAEKHAVDATARDPSAFYPVGPDEFWQLLLPSYRAGVESATKHATFLHLWSELLRRVSYDMFAAPPRGSYLHEVFRRLGTLDRFDRVYGESELRARLTDWIPAEPDLKSVFGHIVEANRWGSEESRSGPGSTLEYTYNLRHELERVIPAFGVKTLFDAPCGDFHWMKEVAFPRGLRYIGGEILPELVRSNIAAHARADRSFIEFDITRDAFPDCDLWFCRDCLFHLPIELIFRALRGFLRSNARYLMASNHINTSGFENTDIASGEFRLLDLHLAPFKFPREVLFKAADYVHPFPRREMCVWSREQVALALSGTEAFDMR